MCLTPPLHHLLSWCVSQGLWISLQGSSVQKCQHLILGHISCWSPRTVTISLIALSLSFWTVVGDIVLPNLNLKDLTQSFLEMQGYIWRIAVFFAICHLHSSVRWGDLSLSSEMTVLVYKSSHCQDSLPWNMVLNDAFGQHFHWEKITLGYSDTIKSGLDIQIKLKPQNGGKGDGYVDGVNWVSMRKETASPTPFTLVSASFQGWLEPSHLLQTCNPAGFLVPQPVSLTKECRNVPNLPFPPSSWRGMRLNSMNLEYFTVNKASFISQLVSV